MSMSKTAKRPPTTSTGTPWTVETWRCTACLETGPDRDDVPHGGCPGSSRGMHAYPLVYSPPSHDAAVALRRVIS